MQGLSFRFALRSTDARVGRYLDSVLSPLRAPVPVAHWYSLVTTSPGRVDLFLDDERVARVCDLEEATEWFLWDLNRSVIEASTKYLLFHAGGVQSDEAGVLLPAPAGSGKSTLVAGLVRAGLDYLSDEVVALDIATSSLLPYPKSVTFKSGSFGLLPEVERVVPTLSSELSSEVPVRVAGSPPRNRSLQISPAHIRAGAIGSRCVPRLVVVPRYVGGPCDVLRALSPREAFLSLATNTVNLDRHGARGVEVLAELVETCDCYELEMSDLGEACRLVLSLLDGCGPMSGGRLLSDGGVPDGGVD